MKDNLHKVSAFSLLMTLGIVFGDIGTSPLYVFTAITEGRNFDTLLVLGSMSCIFWTLLIIATVKYIYFALNADNQGEGGIFALYARLRATKSKWIIYPALVGCATLISDGFITPAISISSAVEGLDILYEGIPTLPIVCGIVSGLFLIQQFGTKKIGGLFGPIMLLWFLTLGILGSLQLFQNPEVLRAVNPMYAFRFLIQYPDALWILGAVFLCTTGAEALYSDLGHCGKRNIRITWSFVLVMLLLNYFGQAAYCLSIADGASVKSVFYATVPNGFLPYVIGIATIATIVASQALITGIFTLVNEAIKLKLWTNLKVKYPTTHKGQVYIPFINYFLLAGCLVVILIFRESTNMESAYGLAITIDMLMTSLLLGYLMLTQAKHKAVWILPVFMVFFVVEGTFFASNLNKIVHGGWFTLLLASLLFLLLYFYHRAKGIRTRVTEYKKTQDVVPLLDYVIHNETLPYIASNLVYPTRSSRFNFIDVTIMHSLFHRQPKRAGIYWFLHIDITDEPYGVSYKVHTIIPKKSFYVKLAMGFKEPHLIDVMIKKVHKELARTGEIQGDNVFFGASDLSVPPDFKYILINSRVATDNHLSLKEMFAIRVYRLLKSIGLSAMEDFGLDPTNSIEEKIPINVAKIEKLQVHRIDY
jgi:KUP system potassium uptake protein